MFNKVLELLEDTTSWPQHHYLELHLNKNDNPINSNLVPTFVGLMALPTVLAVLMAFDVCAWGVFSIKLNAPYMKDNWGTGGRKYFSTKDSNIAQPFLLVSTCLIWNPECSEIF